MFGIAETGVPPTPPRDYFETGGYFGGPGPEKIDLGDGELYGGLSWRMRLKETQGERTGPFTNCSEEQSQEFINFLKQCSWEPDSVHFQTAWALQSDSEPTDNEEAAHFLTNDPAVQRQSCAAKVSGGAWVGYRVGPVITHGNSSWTALGGIFNSNAFLHYGASSTHAFSRYFLGSVDDAGRLVGYPPLHQHHFHFNEGGSTILHSGMHNHGDNQCAARDGGVMCNVHCLPEQHQGYAFVYGDQTNFMNDMVDVRPAFSPPLKTWLVIAVKTINKPTQLRPIRYSFLGLTHLEEPSGPRATFMVRTDIEGVAWDSCAWPTLRTQVLSVPTVLPFLSAFGPVSAVRAGYSFPRLRNGIRGGILREAYFHAHRDIVYDAWLLEGTPEGTFHGMPNISSTRRIHYRKGIIEETMANVMRRQRDPFAAKIACTLASSLPFETSGGTQDLFSRHNFCHLSAHLDHYTLVVFFRARDKLPPLTLPPLAQVHVVSAPLYHIGDICTQALAISNVLPSRSRYPCPAYIRGDYPDLDVLHAGYPYLV